ncbi:MAG: DNA polymerase IV [Nitrospiria bacterium]
MILHIDMDAFYASIEERDRPELRGNPVIVGGSPEGRGVVAAANYAVRAFGVHSAMPASKARRLCPEAVFLPPRIGCYAEVSEQIHLIFKKYTPLVEPLSLDEAFLDTTGSEKLFGDSELIGQSIKQDIKDETRLCASVGIAPNKFVAKVASDLGKPDGFLVVKPKDVQAFLDPLPVRRLWGIGKAGERVLTQRGVRTIYQLRQLSRLMLRELFGSWGDQLWAFSRGRDDRAVIPDHQVKSISNETTFEKDLQDFDLLKSHLVALTEQVAWRLRRQNLFARTVEIKIRFSDFKTVTRSKTLTKASRTTQDFLKAAVALLKANLLKRKRPVRLVGMGLSHMDDSEGIQGELFLDEARQKQQRIDAATDLIRSKYGASALKRGGGGVSAK